MSQLDCAEEVGLLTTATRLREGVPSMTLLELARDVAGLLLIIIIYRIARGRPDRT